MITCPFCQGQSEFYFFVQDYNKKISQEFFSYYRCQICSLVFISPTPPNLKDYYPKDYYYIPPSREALAEGAKGERYKIEIIRNYVREGRLLEIGPAFGAFAWAAKEAGFEVEAIEMDPSCCQFLSEVVGINVVQSDDTYAALKGMALYNVIALWHVIEHLPDPWKMLELIGTKILDDGILVIAAPHPQALQFRVQGKYWPHVDAPRHVMLIPATVIIKKMESLGFKTVFYTTRDKGSLWWNTFGWEYFFSNMATIPLIKRGLHIFGKLVSLILAPIESREGCGSAYTLVFRKEKK